MKSRCRICKVPVRTGRYLCDICGMIIDNPQMEDSFLSYPWVLAAGMVGAAIYFGVLYILS